MNKNQIIENYGAKNITISDDLICWMRSNHAGETGAVWIYLGASCAFWSKKVREMAAEHQQTELHHLIVMAHIVAKHRRSNLIFLWKIMAFGLGFLPSIFGYRAFCITIKAVETFVEKHYNHQIEYLKKTNNNQDLLAVLKKCCAEEVHHQQDAYERIAHQKIGIIGRFWLKIIGSGSNLAVKAAKKF